MTLLDIGFYSWLCFFWGLCAPGFEYTACRAEWTVHNGVSLASFNCYVGETEEPLLFPPEEDSKEKPKPRRARTHNP